MQCLVYGCAKEVLAGSAGLCRAHHREWQANCGTAPVRDNAAKQRERNLAYRARLREKKIQLMGRPKPDACELCHTSGEVVWDHDHATGQPRGWLCQSCNHLLGRVKDDPALLRRMADYVERGGLG